MQPFLIALDMDGTLLNKDGKISEKTKEYLQQLEKEGHKVVISSGRPIRAIIKYYEELGLTSPIVCYNGAYIASPNDHQFVEEEFVFPKEVVKEIYLEIHNQYLANVMCETNKEIWLLKEDDVLSKFFWHDGMDVHYGDLLETLNDDPMTMIIETNSKEADELIIKAVAKHPGLKVRFWNGYYSLFSELYYENVSKAAGLLSIAKYYQIDCDHIIAIGDASNDIEMLSIAKYAVAMINGDDNIKKHATRISKFDNDHDGVLHVLKEIMDEQK